MLTLLLCSAVFFSIIGIVYPILGVLILRSLGDRRPVREILKEL